MHINNIFKEGELNKEATVKEYLTVQTQGGKQPVNTHKWSKSSHDRWVIIDDTLYHCGHSVKDLGKKLSAIMKMEWNPEVVLKEVR